MYESIMNPSLEEMGRLASVNLTDKMSYRDDRHFFNIFIVGCGGTGGYVVRDLSRFLFSIARRDENLKFALTLVDGDIVEEKNLLRQNFLPRDLGKNKAEVLAERHSMAFGLDISAYTEMIDEAKMRQLMQKNSRHPGRSAIPIIIGCVDNNKARRALGQAYRRFQPSFWIDSGNERKSGQVIVGGRFSMYGDSNGIPSITDIYPDVKDPEKDSTVQISCADRLMQDEQNIFVNISAATHVLNFVRKIVLGENMSAHGVSFGIDGVTNSMYLKEAA